MDGAQTATTLLFILGLIGIFLTWILMYRCYQYWEDYKHKREYEQGNIEDQNVIKDETKDETKDEVKEQV